MTIMEAKDFMKRVKSHYQDFIIDDFKIKEWYSELKKYDYEDVNKKFEEHLRSENYGESIPKLYFLTKYLTKTEDKGKVKNYVVYCQLCEKQIDLRDYDKHYSRCSAINYIENYMEKFFNKKVKNKDELFLMSDEKFNSMYDKFLNKIVGKKISRVETEIILKILYPNEEEIVINDMVKQLFSKGD